MEKNINEMIEYPEKGILSKAKTNKLNIALFCMAKDTEISEHTSTKQGFVYILEGKGIFNLKGKDFIMEPGVFIFMKESDVHALKAEENTAFLLTLT